MTKSKSFESRLTLREPTRGWHRVKLENAPNPWGELLQGVPDSESTLTKMETWCKTTLSGKWKMAAYNYWDFKNQDDAVMFSITWG
jgi:hypothetical protein